VPLDRCLAPFAYRDVFIYRGRFSCAASSMPSRHVIWAGVMCWLKKTAGHHGCRLASIA